MFFFYFIPVPNDHTVQKDEDGAQDYNEGLFDEVLEVYITKKILWVHFIFIVSPSTAQKPKQQR